MKHYKRDLNLLNLLRKKSHFLFGPRAVGKSSLVSDQLSNSSVIDLLQAKNFRRYLREPGLIAQIQPQNNLIVIDEIQKVPELLDEVHRLIVKEKITFLLTGSSARKLKRGGANLLAGRAWWAELFPLTYSEIDDFSLKTYLNTGGLPAIYNNEFYEDELKAYTSLYLKEEVLEEALVRRIVEFSEFLDLMALSCGEEINYQSLASDCGVSPNTIKNYLQILKDTLIGFELPAFTKSKKRKAISRSKFYYFDVGVTNSLANRGEINFKSELFGKAFEQFILQEVRAYNSYSRKDQKLSYWRTTSQFEVDLIIGNELAIEIKSSEFIKEKHLKGLSALNEEGLIEDQIIVCLEPHLRLLKNIRIYPWEEFLKNLWQGKLF